MRTTVLLLGAIAVAVGLGGTAAADPTPQKLTLKPRVSFQPHMTKLVAIKPLTPAQKTSRYGAAIKGLPGIVFKSFELEAPVTFTARKLFVDNATFADVSEGNVFTGSATPSGMGAPDGTGVIHVGGYGSLFIRFLAAPSRLYTLDCATSADAVVNVYVDAPETNTPLASGTAQVIDGHIVYALPRRAAAQGLIVQVGAASGDIAITQCDLVPAVLTH